MSLGAGIAIAALAFFGTIALTDWNHSRTTISQIEACAKVGGVYARPPGFFSIDTCILPAQK